MINKINNYVYNLEKIDSLDLKQISKLTKFPIKRYFYKHKKIPMKFLIKILKNRNIHKNIKPMYAITINRCYGKYLPSNIILYKTIEDNYFDRNQATEIPFAQPLHIIHISKDKLWYFIKCYNYYCWVHKKDICIINYNTFINYLNPNKFAITTDNFYFNNVYIDMGIKFPIHSILKNHINIIIPTKKNDIYNKNIIKIKKEYLNIGYLKYSKDNLINQSLKFLDIPYGWGGLNNGIDCSGLIVNIFKTFGILIPRDTSKQQLVTGKTIIKTNNIDYPKIYEILKHLKTPFIIYLNGHVMLILKISKDKIIAIHASSVHKKVVLTELDESIIKKIKSIHLI